MANHHSQIYAKCIKRVLDVLCSGIVLFFFCWLYGIIGLLVRIKLGSPVIYKAKRPGRIDRKTGKEKIFYLYKFRSMTDARDKDGNLLPDADRLTSFGRVLRATSLDELPELFNIVKGDMAIVGPRPLLIKYLPYYREEERERHEIRPGLTGLAQIHGRNFLMWDDRLAEDIKYARKITFLGDLNIILQTVIKVLKRSDVAVKRIPPLDEVRREERQ